MDHRQLEVFAAVAREGGFTRAAEQLHLVQSAVSATVAALEAELGTRLFDRTTLRVTLTEAGLALLPHVASIGEAFQGARDAVDAVVGGLTGTLRIGFMTNVTLYDIPRLLGRFAQSHPGVSIRLAPAATGTAGLAEALRVGELDLAFLAATRDDYPDLDIDVLASSPLGLAVPVDHVLADQVSIDLADTAALRFVDFRPGFSNRTLVDAEFRRRGLVRDVGIETSDTNDTAALVGNGLGVGYLPQYLAEADPRLRWIPLADATLVMHVSIATSRGRTHGAAVARLVELARASA